MIQPLKDLQDNSQTARLSLQDSGIDESRPGLSSNTLNMKAGKRPADDAPQSPDVLALTPAQVEMVRRPITIGLMTNHFFGSEYAHEMEDCNLEDVPLRCTYKDTSMRPDEEFKKLIEEADALWYHAPSSCMLSVSSPKPSYIVQAFACGCRCIIKLHCSWSAPHDHLLQWAVSSVACALFASRLSQYMYSCQDGRATDCACVASWAGARPARGLLQICVSDYAAERQGVTGWTVGGSQQCNHLAV